MTLLQIIRSILALLFFLYTFKAMRGKLKEGEGIKAAVIGALLLGMTVLIPIASRTH